MTPENSSSERAQHVRALALAVFDGHKSEHSAINMASKDDGTVCLSVCDEFVIVSPQATDEEILDLVVDLLEGRGKPQWKTMSAIITASPTQEPLDVGELVLRVGPSVQIPIATEPPTEVTE